MIGMCDVAIVGAGIGGLALAASLARQSMSVQVFEQDAELREIGAGIAIGGNATRLLARLGIDLVLAHMPEALEFRRWRDGGRTCWPCTSRTASRPGRRRPAARRLRPSTHCAYSRGIAGIVASWTSCGTSKAT